MADEIINAELIITQKELKDVINHNFDVCCPKCHSEDYAVYSTCGTLEEKDFGYGLILPPRPEADIHWICKNCRWVWNSEFQGYKYNYKKSRLERYDLETHCIEYKKKKLSQVIKSCLRSIWKGKG